MIIAYKEFTSPPIKNIDKIGSFVYKYTTEKHHECHNDLTVKHDLSILIAPVHNDTTLQLVVDYLDEVDLPSSECLIIWMETRMQPELPTISTKDIINTHSSFLYGTIDSMETKVDIPLQINDMMGLMKLLDQAIKKMD